MFRWSIRVPAAAPRAKATWRSTCRAWKAVTGSLPLPITFMVEGEEECGSTHLFGFVRDHAGEFRRDLALVCDTGMWNPQTPAVTTSLRGLVYEEVRIRCADRDLIYDELLGAPTDEGEDLLVPIFRDGQLVYDPPSLDTIAAKRERTPRARRVEIDQRLAAVRSQLIDAARG